MDVKHLDQCLAHSRCFVNKSPPVFPRWRIEGLSLPIYRWYLEVGRCVALSPGILQTQLEERVLCVMLSTASAKRRLPQEALSESGAGELSRAYRSHLGLPFPSPQ